MATCKQKQKITNNGFVVNTQKNLTDGEGVWNYFNGGRHCYIKAAFTLGDIAFNLTSTFLLTAILPSVNTKLKSTSCQLRVNFLLKAMLPSTFLKPVLTYFRVNSQATFLITWKTRRKNVKLYTTEGCRVQVCERIMWVKTLKRLVFSRNTW